MNQWQKALKQAQLEGKTVVLVTGVFDILHQEHQRFLQKAKQAGDFLLVGMESDQRVAKLKGPGRPVYGQQERVANLVALNIANTIFILPEKFDTDAQRQALIAAIKPDVLAVSAHTQFLAKKKQILQQFGGQVIVVHEYNPAVSSSRMMRKLKVII